MSARWACHPVVGLPQSSLAPLGGNRRILEQAQWTKRWVSIRRGGHQGQTLAGRETETEAQKSDTPHPRPRPHPYHCGRPPRVCSASHALAARIHAPSVRCLPPRSPPPLPPPAAAADAAAAPLRVPLADREHAPVRSSYSGDAPVRLLASHVAGERIWRGTEAQGTG